MSYPPTSRARDDLRGVVEKREGKGGGRGHELHSLLLPVFPPGEMEGCETGEGKPHTQSF